MSRPIVARPLTLGALLDAATDPMPGTGCRLWAGALDPDGYGTVSLDGFTARVPRLVMLAAYGIDLDGPADLAALYASTPSYVQTRHLCAVPQCIEPTHLIAGYARDNAADRRRHAAQRAADDVAEFGVAPARTAGGVTP